MSIAINFTPTSRDLVWAGYAGLRAKPIFLAILLLFFVVLPWSSALFVLLFGKLVSIWSVALLVLVPPISVIAFAFLPVRLFRNSPTLQGVHTYEFSENEIHLIGPGFDNRLQWPTLTRCIQFSGGLQFYSNTLALISIPRRALSESTLSSLHHLATLKEIEFKDVSKYG